ncbi:MAG TPA: protein kinase [Thermoanaerobaculia bacterium]|nr:protein kinase [Thermoanaerobaculia bacterium]
MSLSAGTRLGPYEIVAPLGAGGMGEVYRARDTRLKRDVAVKMLFGELSRDAEHLDRFEREAQMLAAVNHPGIASIYGIEEAGGSRYLVLELVAGETLGARLAGGPLPLDQALEIGRQIADALASAHEKGIVHRDLKPGNVMVTPEGRVKLLDFGLAKNVPLEHSVLDSLSSTIVPATGAGTILGTLAYMSPEQARGREIDRRTDVWAFGCVLYEMLTGRRAFDGQTASDVLVSVLEHEPNWQALPRSVPESIRHLLRRCLEKDAGRRLRDAGDARLDIEEALAARNVPRRRAGLRNIAIGIAAALLAAAAIILVSRSRARLSAPAAAAKLAQLTTAEGTEESPAFSPDGTQLAYAAEEGGVRKIFVKRLSNGEERRLTTGRFDEIQPSWSSDGRAVLFVRSREPGTKLEPADVFGWYSAAADVWRIDVTSGKESRLVENAFNPTESPDGSRIAVDASWAGPRRIWTLDPRGLNPQQVTTDLSEAVAHLRPRWSPDGRRIVYQNQDSTKFDVRVADVGSKNLVWVTNDVSRDVHPSWSASGRSIVFSTDRGGGLNLWRVPVSAEGQPTGVPRQLTTGAGQDVDSAVSRDGKLAFTILKINADLWKMPVDPATGRPAGAPQEVIATTREDSRGAWSPDGKQIAFNSDRSGDMNIWVAPVGSTFARQLTKGPGGDFQPNWAPDGRSIVFFSSHSGNADIWSADVVSAASRQLTKDPATEINPFFSPDGATIAYLSDASGRFEVWVMRADGTARRRLTSVGAGGHFLRWSADGRSVLFRCPCSGQPRTMRVSLDGGEPQATAPVTGGSHISFSPDGSRVLDVLAHKTMWVSPLDFGTPEKVFEFPDPDVRIDYPVWSPDGRWVLFDRFRPQGGDVWLMEGFE